AAGFATVRLPVRWSNHALATAPFTIDPAFLTRVESIIDKLLAKGLYVVLDMHHYHQLTGDHLDSGEFAVSAKVLDTRFVSLWQQIASRFSDKSDHLLFELYNEPHGRLTPSRWNALAARALSVVRQDNPTRIVVLAAANYDLSSLSLPNDANIIGTFHDYSPLSFTHQGAEWVSPPWPIGVTCCDDSQRAAAVAPIAAGKAWSDQWHYPVLLGEFGSYHFGDMNSRAAWTRFMRDQAESRSISWCYWELAWGFGAYDPIGGGSIGVPGDPPSDQGGYWREPLKEALLGLWLTARLLHEHEPDPQALARRSEGPGHRDGADLCPAAPQDRAGRSDAGGPLRRAAAPVTAGPALDAHPHRPLSAHQRHQQPAGVRAAAGAVPVLGDSARRAGRSGDRRGTPRRPEQAQGAAHPGPPEARHRRAGAALAGFSAGVAGRSRQGVAPEPRRGGPQNGGHRAPLRPW